MADFGYVANVAPIRGLVPSLWYVLADELAVHLSVLFVFSEDTYLVEVLLALRDHLLLCRKFELMLNTGGKFLL